MGDQNKHKFEIMDILHKWEIPRENWVTPWGVFDFGIKYNFFHWVREEAYGCLQED